MKHFDNMQLKPSKERQKIFVDIFFLFFADFVVTETCTGRHVQA